jgi:hypothetical protein
MLKKYFTLSCCYLFICILITGCMSFQSNNARQFTSYPPSTIQPRKEKAKINIQAEYQLVGMVGTNDRRQSAVDNIKGWAEDNLKATGVFDVVPAASPADYKLVIRVRDDASPNIGAAFLTGLTLYLIPSTASDNFTTDVTLIDGNNKAIVNKTYKHEIVLWQQLFLVFGAPFATMKSTEEEMWKEILKDVSVLAAENVKI